MSKQHPIRKPVITELRHIRHLPDVAKRNPSKRAQAFKEWMASVETNTKQVSARSGVPYTTLASFVQGDTQSLKGLNEERIANAFGTSIEQIFAGAESQFVPIVGRVGADADGTVVHTDGQAGYDTVPIPPGGTPRAAALEVTGHSMPWLAEDGSLVYFENQHTPPTEDMIGYYVIMELEDGRVLIKRLLRGTKRGFYSLMSQVGPPIEDVRVVWAAEPTAIIPPKQARRIIRRAGERQVA